VNEKKQEIFSALKVAADVARKPILDVELETMSGWLEPYFGDPLFRLIAELPGRNYFPHAVQIEDEIRMTLGLPKKDRGGPGTVYRKAGPPSDVLIERHEREAVVSGQKPERAKAGAELMRKSREAAERRAREREALGKKIKDGGRVGLGNTKTPPKEDIDAMLENFDQELLDDSLDSF
jgi:hypothetical protein